MEKPKVSSPKKIIKKLYIQYKQYVRTVAFSYFRNYDLVDDIVQEVFLKAYMHVNQFKRKSTYKTWLYRITINVCKDYEMKQRTRDKYKPMLTESKEEFLDLSAEEYVFKKVEKQDVKQALLSLSTMHRQVVELYYFKGFSIQEMSQKLGLNPSTIKSRLRRAKKGFKETYESMIK
ncbi:RNA polymerase sigma-70 factor (ECF subfamily) [Bacillus iocasae]|uniref:RNA polymerase sigma factor n=1 Tax=Priestia iocasae TaxID=2291674 RepID=A0ABS2QRU4_9BACI|nr:RNA polymerase sigma factor [Metabacillus iocasae]MBM7702164.1 RNA polymerase sigma-70 factor (ECF subfamily) [Metabacillus iocasae]